MQVFDLGGQDLLRDYWSSYYQQQEAIIFVVDSSDRSRIEIARNELWKMLNDPKIENAIICIFANKQDLQNSMPAAELSQALNLTDIRDRTWTIIATSAKEGTGIAEGLTWISQNITKSKA